MKRPRNLWRLSTGDNRMVCPDPYVSYDATPQYQLHNPDHYAHTVELDGTFGADDLEWIAKKMRSIFKNRKVEPNLGEE